MCIYVYKYKCMCVYRTYIEVREGGGVHVCRLADRGL